MILIGQFDSPFVRRVGIALTIYGFAFEHRPWSVFGDAGKIAPYNPLRRVPALVLEGGETLIESGAILDHLDERAGPDRALIARSGEARRRDLLTISLATGLADKAVSLFYEKMLHAEQSDAWVSRCRIQIGAVLEALEARRSACQTTWWFGETIGHADIAVAAVLRFVTEAHPGIFEGARWPALANHAAAAEALEPFKAIVQPFTVTPPKG